MKKKPDNKDMSITRSSAVEYLTFVAAQGKGGVEVVYADEDIWLTQKMMGVLYDVKTHTINYHLKKVFADNELAEDSVIRRFRITAADAEKPRMGLTTWKDAPHGKIQKFDVSVAKNYLTEEEMAQLARLVNAYLDVAEDMAQRQIPMTMQDWETRLNRFIEATDREILQDAGKVTAEIAKAHAESEFEKYRVVQDRLYVSDFDAEVLGIDSSDDEGGAE